LLTGSRVLWKLTGCWGKLPFVAKRQTIKEKIDELNQIQPESVLDDDIKSKTKKYLSGANNVLAAEAARVIGKTKTEELIPELEQCFHKHTENPVKTDRGCLAKTAIVNVLNKLDYGDSNLLVTGVRYVQMEPEFGGQVDKAVMLRVKSLEGLLRLGYHGIFFELVSLLADRELPVRKAAIESLGHLGGERSELLLRLKILSDDPEPEIYGDCFAALMQAAPDRSLSFVADYILSEKPFVAEDAALCIGNSRTVEAFEILTKHWKTSIDHGFKKKLLLPIALTLCDESVDFLIKIIREEHNSMAASAVEAMDMYAGDPVRRKQIDKAVAFRADPDCQENRT